jgi:hypothetical protein
MITTYKFGIQPPTLNANLVRDQIRRGHNYQNKLIEIEIYRREEERKIKSNLGDVPTCEETFSKAEARLTAIDKKIKAANAKARSKVSVSIEDKQEKLNAKAEFKTAKESLKLARRNLKDDPSLKVAREKLNEDINFCISIDRKSESAPWYGTYMLIEGAFDKTRKMPLYDGIKPNNPRFRVFTGEGRVGIQQFQPNEPISKVIGLSPTSTMVQIVPMPPPPPRKDGKIRKVGKKDLRMLRLRIGTVKGKITPIWAEFPMIYHRPIPIGSVIQVVQVSCNKIANRERWTASITVNDNQEVKAAINNSAVGIDLGWRELPEGMRMAKWHGSDGQTGEIVIPTIILSALRKADEIDSGRDLDFDRAKVLLKSYLNSSNNLPDWLKGWKKIDYIDKWRSQARLVSLLRFWKENRFAGDEEIVNWLEYWRYHDFHLWEYSRSLDTKARGHRNEKYRIEAAQLAEKYDVLIFENLRLDNMARGKIAGSNRQLTAPSEFRLACKNAARTRNKLYKEVPAQNTTKLHAKCGALNDIGSAMEYFCSGCDTELDRDENAAINVLNRGWNSCEHPGDKESAGPARTNDFEDLPSFEIDGDLLQQTCHQDRSQTVLQVADIT